MPLGHLLEFVSDHNGQHTYELSTYPGGVRRRSDNDGTIFGGREEGPAHGQGWRRPACGDSAGSWGLLGSFNGSPHNFSLTESPV